MSSLPNPPALNAFITHSDCARHEMGAHHPECPQRLDAIQDHLLVNRLLDYVMPYDAPLATMAQLERAHSGSYIKNLINAAPTAGYHTLDPDTAMNPYTIPAAMRAAGAAVQATDLVISGAAATAFCCVRPPGHHAERNAAMGFCFFNNVAVGIMHALEHHHMTRVALIDFDVHHGNGSEDIFHDDPRVLMCSIFEKNLYPFSGDTPRGPNMVNIGLEPRTGGQALRESVLTHWLPALHAFKPEMIYISAGFDAHREDDMGNLGFTEHDYFWVTQQIMAIAREYSNGKIVSCLEGGYVLSPLARSVAAHLKVLIGCD